MANFQETFSGSAINLSSKTPDVGDSWSNRWTDTGTDAFSTNGSGLGVPAGLSGGGFVYIANINPLAAANSNADTLQQFTIKANPDSTHPLFFVTRYLTNEDFYFVGLFGTFFRMYKHVGAVTTQVGSDATYTTAINDVIKLVNAGSNFNVFVNNVQKASFTDSDLTSAGRCGIAAGDVVNSVNNTFSAGTWSIDDYTIDYISTVDNITMTFGLFTTPAAMTKSLRYLIKQVPVPTKSLKYTIKKTISTVTKALQYELNYPLVNSLVLYWTPVTTASITKGLIYAVKVPLNPTSNLKYTILKSISSTTKSVKYTIIKSIATVTKSVKYTIKVAPLPTKSVKYTIKTIPSAKTKSLKYAIPITASALTKSAKYGVVLNHSTTKSIRYTIKKSPPITKSLKYTTIGQPFRPYSKITQLINMLVGSGSNGSGGADTWREIQDIQTRLDMADFDGTVVVYFEAIIRAQVAGTTTAELYNKTDGSSIAGSTITTTSTASNGQRVRSGPITISGDKDYDVRVKHSVSGTNAHIYGARLIVVQSGYITKTQVRIDLGNEVGVSSISTTNRPIELSKFLYEASKYDGTVAIRHDAIIKAISGQSASSGIYDETAGSIVSGSTVTTSNTIATRVSSGNITLTNNSSYKPTEYVSGGAGVFFESNQLVITLTNFTKFLAMWMLQTENVLGVTGTTAYQYSDDNILTWDVTDFDLVTKNYYLESDISISNAAETASSVLRDFTTPADYAGSTIIVTGVTTPDRVRSSVLTPPSSAIQAGIGIKTSNATATARLYAGYLVVEVSGVGSGSPPNQKSLKYAIRNTGAQSKSLTYNITSSTVDSIILSWSAYASTALTKSLKYTIYKVRSTTTKSLRYLIFDDHQITKSLAYVIKAPTNSVKSLKYTIKTRAIFTRSLWYTIKSTPALSYLIDELGNFIVAEDGTKIVLIPSLAKTLRYVVKAPASVTKSLKYTVGPFVRSTTKSLRYEVKSSPAITKILYYVVLGQAISISKSSRYAVKKAISVTLSMSYHLSSVSSASITKSIQYEVKRPLSVTKLATYKVKSSKLVVKLLRYVVKIPVSITKSLSYSIKKVPVLTKSIRYVIKISGAITKVSKYGVKTSTSQTKGLVYSVKKVPSITKSLVYKVVAEINITKSLTYFIPAAGRVVKTLSYAVRTSSSTTKAISYKVKSPKVVAKAIVYTVRKARPALTKSLRYELRITAHINIQKSLQYRVYATLPAITKRLEYHIFIKVYKPITTIVLNVKPISLRVKTIPHGFIVKLNRIDPKIKITLKK